MRSSHAHTVMDFHPRSSSSRRACASRSRFRAIFGCQKSIRVFGTRPFEHPWPCQKHPCTNTAIFRLGKTISGLPGRSFRWSRYLKPARWSALRTAISGPVSFERTACMMRRRWSRVRVSAIAAGYAKIISKGDRFFDGAHGRRKRLFELQRNSAAGWSRVRLGGGAFN